MRRETVDTDTWRTDDMHVVCPRAAGLDVHTMCITAAVRLCEAGGGPARTAVREFSALPDGLQAMTDWLRGHGVTAATMEGTGVFWKVGTAASCRPSSASTGGGCSTGWSPSPVFRGTRLCREHRCASRVDAAASATVGTLVDRPIRQRRQIPRRIRNPGTPATDGPDVRPDQRAHRLTSTGADSRTA